MSQKIVSAVFESYRPASKPAYLVALYLAIKADKKGEDIRVTVEEVAVKSRISIRTARETLTKMVEDRWLCVVSPGAPGAPSVYAINADWVAVHAT